MPGRIDDAKLHPWLEELADEALFVAVCSADPYSVVDPLTVEIAVSRSAAEFARTGRLIRNTSGLAWAGIPGGSNISWLAGYAVAINGTPLFSVPLDQTYSFPDGGSLVLAIDDVFVGFDL